MLNSPSAAGPPPEFRLANPLLRLAAWIVDKVVLLPLLSVASYAIIISKNLPLAIFALALDLAYKVILEKRRGATIGKLLLRIRVIRRDGKGLMTWNQSLLRALPWSLGFYALTFVLIRYFQTPGFLEIATEDGFREFVNEHPLSGNTFVSLMIMAPFLSATWILSDPLLRALHDRLGGTVVVRGAGNDETDD